MLGTALAIYCRWALERQAGKAPSMTHEPATHLRQSPTPIIPKLEVLIAMDVAYDCHGRTGYRRC